MRKGFIAIVAAAALLVSCASRPENTPETPRVAWEHRVYVTNEGTRSEGRSHFLAFGGMVLPDVFERVFANGKGYSFVSKRNLWGDDGYVPDDTIAVPSISGGFLGLDAERGYYLGSERKGGTPDDWFRAERLGLIAFIDPCRIESFLAAYPLAEIPRMLGLELPLAIDS